MPGIEGDPAELTNLVAAFTGAYEIYSLAPLLTDATGQPLTSVERIAELMVPVIRELAPSGCYRIAGFSFGALIALEMGHQLREAGHPVEALFLIEAIYDERFWPRRIWLRALTRRTGRHLTRIAHMPPTEALRELRMRATRLKYRVVRRGSEDTSSLAAPESTAMSQRAHRASASYRPPFYDGPLTLIAASDNWQFGCDTADLWSGHISHLHVQRVDGDHESVLHSPSSAEGVARVIDHGLRLRRADWTGVRPTPGFERPMILTTVRWFPAARLAHALSEAGFAVSACRPGGHPLDLVDGLTTARRLHRLWPLRSITEAIRAANPDLVICDDEPALALLRRLYARVRTTDPDMALLLLRSVGDIDVWPIIRSRTELANEVRRLNLATPETAVIDNTEALGRWAADHDLPVVLKTDGSSGGRGVVILRDLDNLPRIWRRISNPPSLVQALKRALVNREFNTFVAWRKRERPVVNAQQFCPGQEAIVTTASVDGMVTALVCLEVIRTSVARGPATVVRIVEHPQMAETARQLIRRLRFTGFCGFDFMVDDSGNAQLLETNPRITPTSHLLVEGDCRPNRLIGRFPWELLRDSDPYVDVFDILDTPLRAPRLIEHGMKLAARSAWRWSPSSHFLRQRSVRAQEKAPGDLWPGAFSRAD